VVVEGKGRNDPTGGVSIRGREKHPRLRQQTKPYNHTRPEQEEEPRLLGKFSHSRRERPPAIKLWAGGGGLWDLPKKALGGEGPTERDMRGTSLNP